MIRSASALPVLSPGPQLLSERQPMCLGARGGQLIVISGKLWVTRRNDLHDYLVGTGERLRIAPGEQAIAEAVRSRQVALVWKPDISVSHPLHNFARWLGRRSSFNVLIRAGA
jgi:hypothetical protein